MTYPLLKKAPKDHFSNEFVEFLINNNKVVEHKKNWLIIENCKYHSQGREWFTAFYIGKGSIPERCQLGELLIFAPFGYHLMIKPPQKRTVERFHVHIFQDKNNL